MFVKIVKGILSRTRTLSGNVYYYSWDNLFPPQKNSLAISLEEARRTTTVYAKMEYGVKRLLWLGG